MKKFLKKLLLITVTIALLINNSNMVLVSGKTDIRLFVDGKDITDLAAPVIENDRSLVPIRFIAEALGAEVSWDDINRSVTIVLGSKSLFLKIDSFIVKYNNGEFYNLSDVAPKIIDDRTYVPLRLISNAFGIGIEWDGTNRTINIDSSKTSEVQPFFDVEITSLTNGDKITKETSIGFSIGQNLEAIATEVKILLLDIASFDGYLIARGNSSIRNFNYKPGPEDNGEKILAVALFNEQGKFIGGDSIAVKIEQIPSVAVGGIQNLQIISETVSIYPEVNFNAAYVTYKIENKKSGKIQTIKEQDALGSIKWKPSWEQNGINNITITAYDSTGLTHESPPISVMASVSRELELTGVTADSTINKEITLYASRNYDVNETQFLIKDAKTGIISTLGIIPYGGFKWFPGPDDSGQKFLFTKVKDTSGVYHESTMVKVTIDGSPKILLKGIGPLQVLTASAELSITSNITPISTRYVLIHKASGQTKYISPDAIGSVKATLSPLSAFEGDCSIQAEVSYSGMTLLSEKINFRVFSGKTYGPEPIIEKDKFLDFASTLAVSSMNLTGMSAALQTAQAILESGWGQSVPVDKYNGTFSNNLFGIKGTGNNGSVISNTWEVYNGISYRVDDYFRAYKTITDGWDDHKSFLMKYSRYETFRSVMYNCTDGAWALKRAGYATDPLYAVKLIKIIILYNLKSLDKTSL